MKKTFYRSNEILSKIKILQKELIYIGKTKGLSHPETLRLSEELDKLIYELQKSIMND
jgi:hypothetical protein